MGAKRVVHVVGTGTLGEPVISLLLNLQRDLEVDEITFHKNRPIASCCKMSRRNVIVVYGVLAVITARSVW